MLHRKIGKTGCSVSILGFGCMRLPVIDGNYGAIDEAESTRLIHAAVDHGVNYIDTAYPYHQGMSEPFTGRALKGAHRDKVNLATKLPSWAIETPGDFDKYLNEQLRRLATDHIDFYLVHALKRIWWDKLRDLGLEEFLGRAVKDGRIRYRGFSFHDELPVFKEIIDSMDWDCCQIQYNFMDREFQAGEEGMSHAASRGIGVIVMEPLRGGRLAAGVPDDIMELWNSAPLKRSPAEWAFRWLWNQPEVSLVLSGMNGMEQVTENCRIAGEAAPGNLTAAELELVEKVRALYRRKIRIPCTACAYCLPCPREVAIPRIFSLYNDLYLYHDVMWAKMMYMVHDNRATECVECGLCEESCPQKIPIRSLLKECHHDLYMEVPFPPGRKK
ncbi:MAG: aldo/keto reductase [Candidatus Eremiobacteraeota bacterium]|nr:aldo/keto reductase [Candidatus Eremiobacteraeota bacterium]